MRSVLLAVAMGVAISLTAAPALADDVPWCSSTAEGPTGVLTLRAYRDSPMARAIWSPKGLPAGVAMSFYHWAHPAGFNAEAAIIAEVTLKLDAAYAGGVRVQVSENGNDWTDGVEQLVFDRDGESGRERFAQGGLLLPGTLSSNEGRVILRMIDDKGRVLGRWSALFPKTEMAALLSTARARFSDPAAGTCDGRPPMMLVDAYWSAMPTRQQINAATPERARSDGFFGKVNLDCLLLETGRLEGCRVAAEWPVDRDLGKAAIALAPIYHLNFEAEFAPIPGSRVEVTVPFEWINKPQ